jgi:LacI family transcriptional regulator
MHIFDILYLKNKYSTSKMSRSTIKEIAKELNLSISTVSRALRDSHEISIDTKNKVLAYAQSVNYRPNPIALGLKERKSHSICVIVPEISNTFYSDVINGIDTAASELGYNAFIFQSHEDYKREIQCIQHGLDRRVDGFAIAISGTTDNYDHLNILTDENVPTVYFDRVPPFTNVSKVVVDNFEGAYNSIAYLIARGRKRIAHISNRLNLSITKERHAGYLACLKDHGIAVDESLIRFCGFDPLEAKNSIRDIVNHHAPDAFFINSDRLTLNSLVGIKEVRHLLKEDVDIVGFTSMKHVSLLDPQMIPVYQPTREMGEKTAKLLIEQIEAKKYMTGPATYVLKTSMVVD